MRLFGLGGIRRLRRSMSLYIEHDSDDTDTSVGKERRNMQLSGKPQRLAMSDCPNI